jgi:hypothetical protein
VILLWGAAVSRALALNNLSRRYAKLGDPDRAGAGSKSSATTTRDGRAPLLYYRASAVEPSDPHAAAWLGESCRTGDRGLLAALHGAARQHRTADPAEQFVAATPAERRALLGDRRVDLLDDIVHDYLTHHAVEDETGATTGTVAMLDLARTDDPALPAALDDPTRFPALIHHTPLMVSLTTRSCPVLMSPAASAAAVDDR